MKNPVEGSRADGPNFHGRDCYVWAEIYYLDSPTDYREYLPEKLSPAKLAREDLVLLDPGLTGVSRFGLLLTALLCCLVAGYFLLR